MYIKTTILGLGYCLLFLWCQNVYTQIQISGVITDSLSGEVLTDVLISSENAKFSTYSDLQGKFDIVLPGAGIIHVSSLGFNSKEIAVDSSILLEIKLSPNSQLLDDFGMPIRVIGRSINLKLPASLMQIYPEHLKRDQDISIAPSINRVTGVFMHQGALNTNRITIRGIGNRSPFSTTKLRAYLDDIPLTGGDGETTIEDIDLSLIDKISVWKGPTASNYGAGLGGMIHLQTNLKDELSTTEFQNNLTVGSFGLIRNVSKGEYSNKNKSFRAGVNVNVTQSEGFRENNQYDRKGVSVLLKYIPNKYFQTTFFGNWIDLMAFIPSSLNEDDYISNPQKAAFTWANVRGFEDYSKNLFGLSQQITLMALKNTIIRNKSSVLLNRRESYESRPFNILSEESRGQGFRTSFELLSASSQKINKPMLSIGLEYYREHYDWKTFQTNDGIQGEKLSDNKEIRRLLNFYLQSYYSINEKATIYSGINVNDTRYEYNDILMPNGIDRSGKYGFEPIISPHLGFSYQFDYLFSLFASISHGFSPPSLAETLTPEGVPNQDISPEQGWNYEIGSRGKIASKFTYELSAYTMRIKDLIVAKRIAEDQFIGLNAGETNHSGIELFLEYQTSIKGNIHLRPFLTYTYSNYTFNDFVDGTNDYSGNKLTGTPPHQLNVGLDFELKSGFYGHLNVRHVDAFPIRDDNTIFSEAYTVANIKVGYHKSLFNFIELDISGGIRNVLNEKYASMILINAGSFGGNPPRYYYPGLPRNYFTSISLRFPLTK